MDEVNKELLELKQQEGLTLEITRVKEVNQEVFNRVIAATESNCNHYEKQIRDLRQVAEEAVRDFETCKV